MLVFFAAYLNRVYFWFESGEVSFGLAPVLAAIFVSYMQPWLMSTALFSNEAQTTENTAVTRSSNFTKKPSPKPKPVVRPVRRSKARSGKRPALSEQEEMQQQERTEKTPLKSPTATVMDIIPALEERRFHSVRPLCLLRHACAFAVSLVASVLVALCLRVALIPTLRMGGSVLFALFCRTVAMPRLHDMGTWQRPAIWAVVIVSLLLGQILLVDATVGFLVPVTELLDVWRTLQQATQGCSDVQVQMVSPHLPSTPLPSTSLPLASNLTQCGLAALRLQAEELLLVTAALQIALGFIGIDYLRDRNRRANALLRVRRRTPAPILDDVSTTLAANGKKKGQAEPSESDDYDETNDDDPTGIGPKISSRDYMRRSLRFLVGVAVPYCFWRTSMEAINIYNYRAFQRRLESDFLDMLFRPDTSAGAAFAASATKEPSTQTGTCGEGQTSTIGTCEESNSVFTESSSSTGLARLELVGSSNFTVTSYTESLGLMSTDAFELVSRKLFSLPKLMLFPKLLVTRPAFVAMALPLAVVLDTAKASVQSSMRLAERRCQERANELKSEQQRVQEHDVRHVQQIKIGFAAPFTQERWESLARRIQGYEIAQKIFYDVNNFFRWLYWSDFLKLGIEVLLASVLEDGGMTVTDVWLYSRVIEDTLDTLLMRTRAEAELSRMGSNVNKLQTLVALWENDQHGRQIRAPSPPLQPEPREIGEQEFSMSSDMYKNLTSRFVPCANIGENYSWENGTIAEISSLRFSRGLTTAFFSAKAATPLRLKAGQVVAITGANGCGKSTTFAILSSLSCATNPVALPKSVAVAEGASVALFPPSINNTTMPTFDVVQLGQTSYFPLFARPMEWFLQRTITDVEADVITTALEKGTNVSDALSSAAVTAVRRIAEVANELRFNELHEMDPKALLKREGDWYGALSGGQRSKADFIRTVFLRNIESASPAVEITCPTLLLIDEGLAAMDPRSKALVQQKLKAFCRHSVVLVIYHTDAEKDAVYDVRDDAVMEEATSTLLREVGVGCVPGGFFNANLHFHNGEVGLRDLC